MSKLADAEAIIKLAKKVCDARPSRMIELNVKSPVDGRPMKYRTGEPDMNELRDAIVAYFSETVSPDRG